MTGGLASHPESWYGSPSTGIGSSSANRLPNFTTPQFVNPRDLQIPTENFADKLKPHEWEDFNSLLVNHLQISSEPSEIEDDKAHSSHRTLEDFTEELVGSLNGLHASHMPRSRRSSVASSLSTDIEDEDDLMVDVVEKNSSDSCGDVEAEIEDDKAHSSHHRTLEDFTEELVGSLNGLHTFHMPRSRRSSVTSSLLMDIEDKDDPMVDVVEKNPCDSCGDVEEGVTMAAIIELEKPPSPDSSLDEEQGVAMAVASILPDDAIVESKKSRSVLSEESSSSSDSLGEEEEDVLLSIVPDSAVVESKKPPSVLLQESSSLSDSSLDEEQEVTMAVVSISPDDNPGPIVGMELNGSSSDPEPIVPHKSSCTIHRIYHPLAASITPLGEKGKRSFKEDDILSKVSVLNTP